MFSLKTFLIDSKTEARRPLKGAHKKITESFPLNKKNLMNFLESENYFLWALVGLMKTGTKSLNQHNDTQVAYDLFQNKLRR